VNGVNYNLFYYFRRSFKKGIPAPPKIALPPVNKRARGGPEITSIKGKEITFMKEI